MTKVTNEMLKAVMAELGKKKSEAKAAAARENGKKGGRPVTKKPLK